MPGQANGPGIALSRPGTVGRRPGGLPENPLILATCGVLDGLPALGWGT